MLKKHSVIIGGLLLCTTLLSINAEATKIYTWKDDAGNTHYTDNPALVPLQSDDTKIIKMKALPPAKPIEVNLDGGAIWANTCATCHRISKEFQNGLRGIPVLIDEINKPESTPASRLAILQVAIDDNMDDLAEIKLTDNEIKALMKYIVQQVQNTAPTVPEQSSEQKNNP